MPNHNPRLGNRADRRKTKDRASPRVEYVYRWDRILVALAALLLVIGLTGYGVYRWVEPTADLAAVHPAGQPTAAEPAEVSPADSALGSADEPPLPLASATREPRSVVIDPPTGTAPDTPSPAAEPPPEPADDQPAERQAKQPDSPPARTPPPADQPALFRLQGISVVSPAVERFLLAKSVINNEPRGDIEAIVPKADGAAAVYCFSDVVGMKDKVLYYHWLRDGKRVAKVRVGAWGKRWRSHSSKILNPTMKGNWRVELRKSDSTLLASAEFVYR